MGKTGKFKISDDTQRKDHGEKTETEGKDSDHQDKEKKPSFFTLFRYRSPLDTFLLLLGTLMALASGCIQPVALILLGRGISVFVTAANFNNGTSINATDPYATVFDEMFPISIIFFILGGVVLVTGTLSVTSWAAVAERQIREIRIQFFQSVMRQDIAWFETHKSGELNTRFSEDMLVIYEGIGLRLAEFLQNIFLWLTCVVSALVLGWKLALVSLSFGPAIIVIAAFAVRFIRNVVRREMAKYAQAGDVAIEAFTSIRTVHAFQGQEKECARYDANLIAARDMGGKKGLALGLSMGSFWVFFFGNFAVSLWYIIHLMQTEDLDPGSLYPVIVLVTRGSASLGIALPFLEVMSKTLASCSKVFTIIDTVPKIDSSSHQGQKLKNTTGNIEFRDVCFSYPSRPNVQVLKKLTLTVPQGKVLALVGPSGSGKSTTVQLLQRFYDPLEGQIMLDGHDIKDLNINWLRHQFGVVSQEPVLFDTTIAENIRYGNMDIDQEGVEKAAREANAHDFISNLPQGYETVVGDRGAQLSGGQKQRIAIARALVRNPKILLLDEATSALDHESEAIVQSALEQAEKGRTTLVIAHRLSTVKNADIIVVISHGDLVEQGTHEELLQRKGLYEKLVKLQTKSDDVGETDMEEIQLETDYTEDDALDLDSSLQDVSFKEKYQNHENGYLQKTPVEDETSSNDSQVDSIPTYVSFLRLVRLNSPEWILLVFGSFGAAVFGIMMPAFAFIVAEFMRVFGLKYDPNEQSRLTAIFCAVLAGIGFVAAIVKMLQMYCFAKSGAALTARIRSMTFRAIVNQDMDFFDDAENQVGFLVTRLSSDAQLLQSTTAEIGSFFEALSCLVSVVIICIVTGWKLGLMILIIGPILVMTSVFEMKRFTGISDTKRSKICGKICTEATDNIRTVASLCREGTFLEKYESVVKEMCRVGIKRTFTLGLSTGFGFCILFLVYGSVLGYGSYLVQNGEMEYSDVFKILIAALFGSSQCGRAIAGLRDYRKGKAAAGRLFDLIDRPTTINTIFTQGRQLENYSGALSMTNVWFRYKSRPNVTVLKGVSFDVKSGETVALVGTSGSGKSTMIQLIERFYDVEGGAVLADKTPTPSLDLKWWRSQIALVSQEPILFDCSIADNIAYGDNSRVVPMEDIIAAARMANIHSFIDALPLGYETNVGSHGTQLSGGQKQRVAIARALIRNPKILLLDEATSSLDSDSERIIQETLEKARQGRTCIVIAHRLTTVQNSDKIAVLKQGEIIEVGTHSELLEKKGAYFNQIQAQHRVKKDL